MITTGKVLWSYESYKSDKSDRHIFELRITITTGKVLWSYDGRPRNRGKPWRQGASGIKGWPIFVKLKKVENFRNALQAPGMTVATPSVPSNDSYFALAEVSQLSTFVFCIKIIDQFTLICFWTPAHDNQFFFTLLSLFHFLFP